MAVEASGQRRRVATRARAVVALIAVVALVAGGLASTRLGEAACPATASAGHPEWSVARRWDEALLDAIRRSLPNPPVHARNLFHTSVAMWDAWAAYDPAASGYVFKEKLSAPNVEAARKESISYAAYRVLSRRFLQAVGNEETLAQLDGVMASLCYDLTVTTTDGTSPAAVGNRIAAAVIAYGLADGSNEAGGYAATDYEPVNDALVVDEPGTTMIDPNRWQPLQLEQMISQNGIPVTDGVQQAVGPYWGHVKAFAIPPGGEPGVPIDPGPPPTLGDPTTDRMFKDQAIDVIRASSQLDPANDTPIDISPGARGANPLGSDDGIGHPVNPATGLPYPPQLVRTGDFSRALTEFWADGPKSETPPGHWNVLANEVSDELAPNLRIGRNGEAVERLEWDVKLYLALNGAVHDAAVAAWGLKGRYDSSRPISMIRYMGGKGQSSDPGLPSYHPEGLPLVDGLVELITAATTAPGGRHEALAGHAGEIAVKAWRGNPADPRAGTGGVGWIRAVDWVPYQLPTFVTPAFQGYVSGHSTFSRAAAEVMAAFTGSEWFPGGLGEWTIEPGELRVETGPSAPVTLQAATYYDAADQAGQSRIFGGIHVAADDFTGRTIGAQCGRDAWSLAQRYYSGQAG